MSLPKDFDESTIEFYDGEFGETKSKNVNYKVKNNVIYGNYDGVLKSNEALLIKCDLPTGYFINYNDEFSIARLILLFIPILLAMEALLFYKYYKNSIIYAKIFLIISIIVSYCIVFLSSLNLLDRVIDNYFLILLFIFAIFVLMLYSLFSNRFSQKVKLIIIFTGIIICLILWIIIVLPAILNKIFYLIESIIAFLLIIILWICLGYMFKK